jgi:hypothetical protein
MDRYTARINLYGTTQRERELNRLKQSILKDSPDSLSYKTVKINGNDDNLTVNSSSSNPDVKLITSLPNKVFHIGDYVNWSNNAWLITKADADDEIYVDGEMQLCNYTLTFQSKINGTILSYPCVKTTSNTIGIQENKVINAPDGTVYIELPFDSDTKLLDVDDRFFIDDLSVPVPQVYAVSKPDRTSNKGIIKLTMKQDAYNKDTDDISKGVCGKRSVVPIPTDGSTYSTFLYSGDLSVGAERTITAKAYNSDKTENTTISLVWNIAFPVGYESYFAKTISGNTCKINVSDEAYVVCGMTVKVSVDDGSGGYVGTKDFEITM